MVRFVFVIYLIVSILTNPLYSQTATVERSIDNVYKHGFRGLKSIVNTTTGEVFGHYLFYRSGSSLVVEFLDLELNTYKKEYLDTGGWTEIKEAVFNGQHLLFSVAKTDDMYYDGFEDYFSSTKLFSYSIDGEQVGRRSVNYFVGKGVEMSVYPGNSDDSFYIIVPMKNKSFSVEKYTSSLQHVWTKEYRTEKGVATCEAAFTGSDRIALIVRTKDKRTGKRVKANLVCLNDQTGDEMFVTPLNDDKITAIPSQVLIDNDGNVVTVGDYYKGDKERSRKSKGIVMRKISPTGEDIYYNQQKWRRGVKRQMRKSKANVGMNSKVLFQDLVQSADGGYQLIGETFSTSQVGGVIGKLDKGVSTVVAATTDDNIIADIIDLIAFSQRIKVFTTAIVSGRYIGFAYPELSPGCIIIQDFVVFNFDDELNFTSIDKIAKPSQTKVYTYHPYDWYGGLRKAKTVADFGFFDYAFSQQSETDNQKILVYNASYARKPHIGVVRMEKGLPVETKEIYFKKLTGDKGDGKYGLAGCAPSVPGKMVVYYFVGEDTDDETKKKGSLYFYLEGIEL